MQQQVCSRFYWSTGPRIKQRRRRGFWKGHRLRLKEKLSKPRSLLMWSMVSTMLPTSLSRLSSASLSPCLCSLLLLHFFSVIVECVVNYVLLFPCRTKHSLSWLLTMWTQLNWLSGFQHCAGKWKSLTALWKEKLAWER